MNSEIQKAVFYHIYPLGLCNCPKQNDFCQSAGDGLKKLTQELPGIRERGFNAVYIGPLFESTAHGYDTLDYFWVDRRLGTNADLATFVETAHRHGIKVVLDAVFNHSGRHFFAFKDLQLNLLTSRYKDWYQNINFNSRSSCGDGFSYQNWAGCDDLVKFNLDNPEVREHIFAAVKKWITEFRIDGLRLDAADVMSFDFMARLRDFALSLDPDFWLMGEVVHGDYNQWVNGQMLHSVTNYQLHKGMWSSFNEKNFFEVRWSLNQMFSETEGKYRGKQLYNFLDNHDVNRIASTVKNPDNLKALYTMLFAVPGIPSVYYGSEVGLCGKRTHNSDYQLRPALPPFAPVPDYAAPHIDGQSLLCHIKKLSEIRQNVPALQNGTYTELSVSNTTFAFMRQSGASKVIAAFNCEDFAQELDLKHHGKTKNLFFGNQFFLNGKYTLGPHDSVLLEIL
ncbi:MAG: alpha-amylase family glycosyl hydrolase [Treponemataceae bacterium]|nr:alpha-amylase family glycosyl hydrolase [Treponemataceae bacterium]